MWKGLGGAVLGGTAGHFLTVILESTTGLWAGMVPGAGVGLGFAYAAKRSSVWYGVLCALLGLLAGLITDSQISPFYADPSASYYFAHCYDLDTANMAMVCLGGLAGGWFGRGRPESNG